MPRFVTSERYTRAFGAQWKRYRRTQLDSYTGVPISAERARRCVGDSLWGSLSGKHVLECGCGAGRFTEVLLDAGAHVTSVDLSEAVDANAANFPPNDHHRIAQADLLTLPFRPQSYDVVFCLGVIQHTPNPERTIGKLAEQVRPGGWLVIDHYHHSLSWWTKSALILRQILKRLPPDQGLRWTERIVDVCLPLHARVRRHALAHALVSRVSPVWSYYRALPDLPDNLQREWALLDTHDGLTDWYKHFRTVAGIRRALLAAGLVDVYCARGGIGIEARARKPDARVTSAAQNPAP